MRGLEGAFGFSPKEDLERGLPMSGVNSCVVIDEDRMEEGNPVESLLFALLVPEQFREATCNGLVNSLDLTLGLGMASATMSDVDLCISKIIRVIGCYRHITSYSRLKPKIELTRSISHRDLITPPTNSLPLSD